MVLVELTFIVDREQWLPLDTALFQGRIKAISCKLAWEIVSCWRKAEGEKKSSARGGWAEVARFFIFLLH